LSRVAIVAFGAVSALGEGAAAANAGEVGEAARVVIARDDELTSAGLTRPFAARARVGHQADRAAALLERAVEGCASQLDRARPSWRNERVGMVLGTSAGAMRSAERAFAALARGERSLNGLIEGPTYYGPLEHVARKLGMTLEPCVLVLAACASSTVALGLGARWLGRGTCDVVLAGGFDDVTVFVAAGFEALRATTACIPPRPFRVGRDGMALGEGAAVLALVRAASPGGAGSTAYAYISGFGAACDAVHLTAPDRNGSALARAARGALEEAGRPAVDLVGAHATATEFNDAAESRAMAEALGATVATEVVVHPFKAQIGHTLGAAGALETLACVDAIARGVLPASAGEGAIDPTAPARLLGRGIAARPRAALKLSSAFGGANAALVVTEGPRGHERPLRSAYVQDAVHVDREPPLPSLAERAHTSVERIERADGLVRLALAAVAKLEERRGSGKLAGAGIVVGTALATLETNAVFAARLRELGARRVEPRRFPYTSPNAAPGECSIAFGLTGPSLSVGGGMHAAIEGLATGALLIEAGDAERVVVVAVDDAGPVTRALGGDAFLSGAVAVLLSAERTGARARVGQMVLRRGPSVPSTLAPGHLALVPLASSDVPRDVTSAYPPNMLARVALEGL
jgi:3-oxoacyl-(acyl-carrier-protein) synthase